MTEDRIFIPQQYGIDYCKSPQAIVFEDFVRIYFSYCVSDGVKLISKVAFIDFDKHFNAISDVHKDILGKSKLGTFDEHGIFPFSPFRDGNRICAVTTGWSRRKSVSTDTGIGLAISADDGATFKRMGDGPILSSSLYEPFLVCDGFVVQSEDNYIMYYIFGTDWAAYEGASQPERTYRIGVASSKNLLDWDRYGEQIIPYTFEGEAQALPSVIYKNGKWHMFFCYRNTVGFRMEAGKGYRIGYAYSEDMYHWTRDDGKISIPISDWCSEMQCYPNVFDLDGEAYLLYNGNHFGKDGFGIMKLEEL
ncbi:hypothetical protein SAMN02910292_00694 [Lachnospiraceae bacterium XBB2008]|nr:hypothetical protein SAMN02910292_00694 [Lachnospiraceae bacterium XBB2008]